MGQTEKIKMIKQFILIIGFVLCIFPQIGYGGILQGFPKSIPKEDIDTLENFFAYMVSYECFGYVLFGDKPMSAGGFDTHFTLQNSLSEGAVKQRRLYLGWKTWEKYASLFPSKKFILRISKNPISPSFYWIVLINKDACLKCIESNLKIFRAILGDSITPQSILDKLETTEDIFGNVLNQNDCLLGILFGYGTHNSIAFQKKIEKYKLTKAIYSKRNKSDKLEIKLVPFNNFNRDLIFIDLPRFAKDPNHSDSRRLHALYWSNWKLLTQLYSNKRFLEVTLKKLTENNNLSAL